jgi:hypothetical protein
MPSLSAHVWKSLPTAFFTKSSGLSYKIAG